MTKFGKILMIYITCLFTCTLALISSDILKADAGKTPIALALIMLLLLQLVGSLWRDPEEKK